ncbi:DUF4352 domain-containing protein [Nonomuraea mangrovi]|uniref:DUF4352 domain-containing protein n=1 Tax=Nonomuraea mangrovi TaxID=2316207 RepID=A0ABW4TEX4_9ACTN
MTYPYGSPQPGPGPYQQHTQPGYIPQQYPPPPGPGYGYAPPPPPPPKKSSAPLVLTIVGVVLLLVFGGCAVLVSNLGNAKRTGTAASQGSAGVVGELVQDGDLAFTVLKTERKDRVGSYRFGEEAQGVFLLVHVRVANVGDQSESFFGSRQKLIDAGGREYAASTKAAIYLRDSNSLYEKINPGNSVEGVIVFDIPTSATPTIIELHNSGLSQGAKVKLP